MEVLQYAVVTFNSSGVGLPIAAHSLDLALYYHLDSVSSQNSS